MDNQVNTFDGGMNMDIGLAHMPPNMYPYAENIRLISDGSNENYEITNVRGNSFSYQFPSLGTLYKITTTGVDLREPMRFKASIEFNGKKITVDKFLSPTSVLDLYAKIHSLLSQYGLISAYSDSGVAVTIETLNSLYIKKLSGCHNTISITSVFSRSSFTPQVVGSCNIRDEEYVFTASGESSQIWRIDNGSPTLLYHNKLNFDTSSKIRACSFYNNENNKRIYFTDNKNNLRQFNAGYPWLLSRNPDEFEIVNRVNLSVPMVTNIGAGNLKCGVIYYSYQLYKLNGPVTKFSDLSYPVNLSDSDINSINSRDYRGGDVDISSNKSCTITIEGIDTSFNYIRVVSVFYDTVLGVPTIKLIAEKPCTSTVVVIDSGNENLGTYTLEEFNAIGGTIFKCKDISVKNNLLIAANIEEEYFDIDFDFRAYRRDSTGVAMIADQLGNYTEAVNVPLTHDCIQTKDDQYTYKYNEDGVLGGSGPNVKYEFKIKQVRLDEYIGSTQYYSTKTSSSQVGFATNLSYSDYASPYNGQFVGYQRDEVYSFAVVAIDEYGRESFSYWIADIKFPAEHEQDTRVTHQSSRNFEITWQTPTYANILYPVFTFKNKPINPNTGNPYELKIVRMERGQKDRTIVAQGALLAADSVSSGGTVTYRPSVVVEGNIGHVGYFISPDVIISSKQGGDLDVLPNDKIYVYRGMNHLEGNLTSSTYSDNYNGTPVTVHKHRVFKFYNGSNIDNKGTILGAKNLVNGGTVTLGGYTFSNSYFGNQPINKLGIKTAIYTKDLQTDFWHMKMANIVRELPSQYGGNTYSSRTTRQYVDCVQYNGAVFGGDTYICMFDYLNRFLDTNYSWSTTNYMFENWYFPVETVYNLKYRTDEPYNLTKNGANAAIGLRLQEYAGFYTDGNLTYTQNKDLYLYNTVYLNHYTKTYSAKPLTFVPNKKYDCRILASERKVINEEIDNWTRFLPQNYIDIDTSHGPINACIYNNNDVYCFQDTGVGVVSIDQRSIISDNNVSKLVLGTGDVLARYDYVNTMSGSKHKWSAISTPKGLFYYDIINKSINHITGEKISDIKGLKSFFSTNDLITDENSILGYYDSDNRELVYSMPDKSVSISLLKNVAQCFYTFTSPHYISFRDKLYSVLRSTTHEPDRVYEHNGGNWNEFYDEVNDSNIRWCVNKNYSNTKVFDAFTCDMNETIDDNSVLTGFFSSFEAWNTYQYTGLLNFVFNESFDTKYSTRVSDIMYNKKHRTFSFFVPRNAVSTDVHQNSNIFVNVDFTRTHRERMKDKYLIGSLKYGNGNKMLMSYITTNFRYIYE